MKIIRYFFVAWGVIFAAFSLILLYAALILLPLALIRDWSDLAKVVVMVPWTFLWLAALFAAAATADERKYL